MARLSTVLRQWCPDCARITRTWLDIMGHSRCSGCDPESSERPGWGVRDFEGDDD